jgi:PKD repeat protein
MIWFREPERSSSKIAICLVSLILLGAFFVQIPQPAAAATYPTVTITIERIQKVDDFGFGDTPGWYYYVGMKDSGASSYTWIRGPSTGTYPDNTPIGASHDFVIHTSTAGLSIYACDDDTLTGDDFADISSDPQGGADNVNCSPPATGTYFGAYKGTWNLATATLTGDITVAEPGGLKTSGDFDGSTGTDENDANLWFTISDNYYTPTAEAGPNKSGYIGDSISFNGGGSTASPGSSIELYEWDYNNDGSYDASGVLVSTSFSTKGVHTVKLRVTDSIGQTSTDTTTVTILNKDPVAAFTYSPLNPTTQETITFTSTSTDPDGTISSWSWIFGDGGTSTAANPSHQYSDDGTYDVSLTVTDNDGASDTVVIQIDVANMEPVADFSFTPASPSIDQTIQFTDASSDIDGSISSWSWDFGDGSSSTQQNPSHEYSSPGTFSVSLTVTDNDDDSDEISQSLTVLDNEVPSASFSTNIENPSIHDEIQFTDGSSDPDGDIAGWDWNFGDGETSSAKNPKHKYAEAGNYTVTLTVTDDKGATDSFSMQVNVAPTGGGLLGLGENAMLFILVILIVIIVIVIAVALLLWRRKRSSMPETEEISDIPPSD